MKISIEDQAKLFAAIGKSLKRKIEVYAVGGTAMMFLGLKEATLDIDLVFETENDRIEFKKAAEDIGYKQMNQQIIYGDKQNSPEMLTKGDERFDLFVGRVVHFYFSKDMQNRSSKTYEFEDKLIVKVADYHDIIIMKCATDRSKDLDDVISILENKPIDWDILLSETKNQIRLGNQTTAFVLGEFLEKLQKLTHKVPKIILSNLYKEVKHQIEAKLKNS